MKPKEGNKNKKKNIKCKTLREKDIKISYFRTFSTLNPINHTTTSKYYHKCYHVCFTVIHNNRNN